MIRSLRNRHRRFFIFLAVVLPLLFLAALLSRKDPPRMSDLHSLFPSNNLETGPLLMENETLLEDMGIRFQLFEARDDHPRRILKIHMDRSLSIPDPLLYWYAGNGDGGDQPPDTAFFLGVLDNRKTQAFLAPERSPSLDDWVMLYSLGHQKKIAAVRLDGEGGSPKGEKP